MDKANDSVGTHSALEPIPDSVGSECGSSFVGFASFSVADRFPLRRKAL